MSTARLFGEDSQKWLAGFLAAAVTCLMIAVLLVLVPREAGAVPLMVALAGVWAFGWHLFWQMRRLNPADPASCLAVFRSNRDAGLILWLFLAAASVL
jgi:4-hydroxybenzoate polyprenyltransferase